jgi:hypothetical protein
MLVVFGIYRDVRDEHMYMQVRIFHPRRFVHKHRIAWRSDLDGGFRL